MSIRGMYTFVDENEKVHVYKWLNNNPWDAANFIIKALNYSWELPRFEAGEFASAFIKANHRESGDTSISSSNRNDNCDYFYEVSCKDSELYVKASFVDDNYPDYFEGKSDDLKTFYEGNIIDFNNFFQKERKKAKQHKKI